MQLSAHFSIEEMTVTEVRGVDNSPPPEAAAHLVVVALALEQIRELLGNRPIHVTSGFRCTEVNTRVGGAPDSAHLYGYAADFICPAFGSPLKICAAIANATTITFDQLINEGAKGKSLGWVHISVDPRMRRQILTANFETGHAVYIEGLPVA